MSEFLWHQVRPEDHMDTDYFRLTFKIGE